MALNFVLQLAILNEAKFFETSSKLNVNVDLSFESLAKKIVPSNNREQNLVQNPLVNKII